MIIQIDQILAEEKQNFDVNQPVVLRIPSMQAPGYQYNGYAKAQAASNFEVPCKDIVS